MGSITKLVAQYSQPIWRAAGPVGSAFSHSGLLREIHDPCARAGSPVAPFGFAPSPQVTAVDFTGPAIEQFTALCGPGEATPEEVPVHGWSADQIHG
jgi:monoamine oxidase